MTERGATQRLCHAFFIESVAALVHGAVQPRGEERLIPASRDPHVAGAEAGGEWMHRVVHPPAGRVEAHHPHDLALAISAASSLGTRRAFSQRRRVTRTRLASSVSGAAPLNSELAASIKRPVSSETNISWLIRSSVASDSARLSAPRGGIIV